MKSMCVLSLYIISILVILASAFLAVGLVLSLIFPISAFQGAIILLIPFCLGVLYLTLNDIGAKLGSLMDEEDAYSEWEDLSYRGGKHKAHNQGAKNNSSTNKIIVMKNAFYDKEAPCPCGSGEKYKNCCGKKHLEKE
ncbi:MAG: SEC-C metal-binding domain-containing protein [bacterium]